MKSRVLPDAMAEVYSAQSFAMVPQESGTSTVLMGKDQDDPHDMANIMRANSSGSQLWGPAWRRAMSGLIPRFANRPLARPDVEVHKIESPRSLPVHEMVAVAAGHEWHVADASREETWAVPDLATLVVVVVTTSNIGLGLECIQELKSPENPLLVPIIALIADAVPGHFGDLHRALDIHCDLQACGVDDVVHGVESRDAFEWAICASRLRSVQRRGHTTRSAGVNSALDSLRISEMSWAGPTQSDRLSGHFAAPLKSFAECGVNTDAPPDVAPAPALQRGHRSRSPSVGQRLCSSSEDPTSNGSCVEHEEEHARGKSPRPPPAPGMANHLRKSLRMHSGRQRPAPRRRKASRSPTREAPPPAPEVPRKSGADLWDGIWVSKFVIDTCGRAIPDAAVSDWLRVLNIRGNDVLCATGEKVNIRDKGGRRFLHGGELLADNDLLMRVGKSGIVVVYRRTDCDLQ